MSAAQRDSKKGWCLITSCAANPFLFALTLKSITPHSQSTHTHTHTHMRTAPCARTYVKERDFVLLWSGPTDGGIPFEFPSCGQKGLKSLIMAFKCQRIINCSLSWSFKIGYKFQKQLHHYFVHSKCIR